jgi:hypothetical protein
MLHPIFEPLHCPGLDLPGRINRQVQLLAYFGRQILVRPGVKLVPHDHRVPACLDQRVGPCL